MVWCMVNPNVVKETLQFLEDTVIDEEMPLVVPITHKFTQIGKPSVIVSYYSSKSTPSQILHIKYQRMNAGNIQMTNQHKMHKEQMATTMKQTLLLLIFIILMKNLKNMELMNHKLIMLSLQN